MARLSLRTLGINSETLSNLAASKLSQWPLPASILPLKISGLGGPSTCNMPARPRSARDRA